MFLNVALCVFSAQRDELLPAAGARRPNARGARRATTLLCVRPRWFARIDAPVPHSTTSREEMPMESFQKRERDRRKREKRQDKSARKAERAANPTASDTPPRNDADPATLDALLDPRGTQLDLEHKKTKR